MSKLFPEEIKAYIFAEVKGCPYSDLTEKINKKFGINYSVKQIMSFCQRNKCLNCCKSGTQFSKGHIPWNKGKNMKCSESQKQHWFQKGHKPPQTKPIGYERIDKDGYIQVKVSDNNFIPKQRLIYEKHYGSISDNECVIFLDGNKRNFNINNLALVSKAENLELTRKNLRTNDTELSKTGVMIAKINCKNYEFSRNKRQK